MKYNAYFETRLYRECALEREHKTEELVRKELFKAMLISLIVSLLVIGITIILIRFVPNLLARFVLIIVTGLLCGWQLGLIRERIGTRICGKIKHLFDDIQVLTNKIEQMQDETDEDYELIGEKDEERDVDEEEIS